MLMLFYAGLIALQTRSFPAPRVPSGLMSSPSHSVRKWLGYDLLYVRRL